ncbi:MAG: tRNA lysidine(34) synthetase TilS [Pseudomonadota bacterium]
MRLGADFTALVDRFPGRLYVAVSGGSDSLALLLMAAAWAQTTDQQITALTVDHRLRPESADEAASVAALCQTLGCDHQTLVWDSPQPQQSAARRARYRLLASAVRPDQPAVLLTGHTFDDVVETALIRRRRGVRNAAIAGPTLSAPIPLWPLADPVTLLRPLIRMPRAALQTWLSAQTISWASDPSNQNPAYERVRVRTFLQRHPRLRDIAQQSVARYQQDRACSDQKLAAALSNASVTTDGLIEVAEADLSPRLLILLARCASGGTRDARASAATEALSTLRAAGQRQTLGGAWLQRTANGLVIGRDPGAEISLDHSGGYDGRFAIEQGAKLPAAEEMAFLVRHARPEGPAWRETVSARVAHMARCLETPFCNPVTA